MAEQKANLNVGFNLASQGHEGEKIFVDVRKAFHEILNRAFVGFEGNRAPFG